MSLWLDSLDMALSNAGKGRNAATRRLRAKIVLAYFAMPVPGSIVARWLPQGGPPPDFLIAVARNALRILHEVEELRSFDMAHLLALGLESAPSDPWKGTLADPDSDHPISAYVAAADRHLQAHPELRQLVENRAED